MSTAAQRRARVGDYWMRVGAQQVRLAAEQDPRSVPEETAARAAVVLGKLPATSAHTVQGLILARLAQGEATTQMLGASVGLPANTMGAILRRMQERGEVHSRPLERGSTTRLWMLPGAVAA